MIGREEQTEGGGECKIVAGRLLIVFLPLIHIRGSATRRINLGLNDKENDITFLLQICRAVMP